MCHVIDSMLYPPENTLVQFSLYPLKVKNIDISQALSIGGYKRWHTLVSFISPRRFSDIQNKTLDNGHSHKKYLGKWTHILLCANRKKILLHSVGHSRYSTWSVEIPLLLYLFVELYIPYNGDCVMFSFLVKAITTWSRVLIFTHTGSFTKLTEWFILVWIFY